MCCCVSGVTLRDQFTWQEEVVSRAFQFLVIAGHNSTMIDLARIHPQLPADKALHQSSHDSLHQS